MLRTSERLAYKSCRWRWHLEFMLNLKPTTAAPALRFGSLMHQALAAYYPPGLKRGEKPADAFGRLYRDELKVQTKMGFRDEDGRWHEAGALGVAMLENYVETYGKDDEWEVLVTEQPFEVMVHHPETGEPWFLYVGVLDGVWRHRPSKRLWVPDHKTTDGIGEKKWIHLIMDDQAGAYWSRGVEWLYQEGFLKKDQRLAGMQYNLLRKAMPDERPWQLSERGKKLYLNQDGSVSKKQPPDYFKRIPVFRDAKDRASAMARQELDFAEIQLVRAGELQIGKTPGMFTCPSCWARDACELHETGHDWETFLAQTTKTWDPYAEHEVYDGR
jgi:hypothetical protein